MTCRQLRALVLCLAALAGCEKQGTTTGQEHAMKGDAEITRDEQGRFVMGDLVLTPESENRDRAELLPTEPSEDARHVLGTIELRPSVSQGQDERDYLPEPAVSWILDIQFEGDPPLQPLA